jgi:hypothetical protein
MSWAASYTQPTLKTLLENRQFVKDREIRKQPLRLRLTCHGCRPQEICLHNRQFVDY